MHQWSEADTLFMEGSEISFLTTTEKIIGLIKFKQPKNLIEKLSLANYYTLFSSVWESGKDHGLRVNSSYSRNSITDVSDSTQHYSKLQYLHLKGGKKKKIISKCCWLQTGLVIVCRDALFVSTSDFWCHYWACKK